MINLHLLDTHRLIGKDLPAHFKGYSGDHTCGAFVIPSPIDQAEIVIMASSDFGWEHVSASRNNRCPNWLEMDHIKHLFFKDEETVMQVHVPKSDHVNDRSYCLHLWRPTKDAIPLPPKWMVGGMTPEEAEKQMALLA